jgi:hypothetical protein
MSSMSMHTGGPPEAAQIEGLIKEFDALRAAMAHARHVRTGLFLLAVVFVAGVCFAFANFATQLASPPYLNELKEALRAKVEKSAPDYQKDFQDFLKTTSPVVASAFTERVKKDIPGFMKNVEAERGKFVDDIRAKLEQRLQEQYTKILQKHSETLKAEFPTAQDPAVQTKLAENLRVVFEKMARKFYLDDLNHEMVSLYDQLDKFPAADAPGKGEPSTEDQIIGTLLELLKGML